MHLYPKSCRCATLCKSSNVQLSTNNSAALSTNRQAQPPHVQLYISHNFFTLSHSLLGDFEYFHFQVCNTVQEQQCNTVNEQKCETKYETVNEQQCSTVQEQQCNTVNEQQCSTVNEQQCSTVQEQQCRTVQDTVNEQVRSIS